MYSGQKSVSVDSQAKISKNYNKKHFNLHVNPDIINEQNAKTIQIKTQYLPLHYFLN